MQNWGTGPDGQLVMESARDGVLDQESPQKLNLPITPSRILDGYAPYHDYCHFYGTTKPWQNPLPYVMDWNLTAQSIINNSDGFKSINNGALFLDKDRLGKIIWFTTLDKLNDKLQMGLGNIRDADHWNDIRFNIGKSPLGLQISRGDMNRHVAGEY